MANLNKLLVHVPSNLCDGFKTKYVDGTDRSYDSKVVFLEKTQEIFTKGKIYSTSIQDFNALKELVGKIPSGATSTNVVDYINEKINSADYIHSVSKKSNETLIEVTTSNKAVTINSTKDLNTAVSYANSAVQSVSILGKTLNKTNNSLTVEDAKKALGLKSAAYQDSSAFDAAGDASAAAAGVVAKLPVVTNGSGIIVTPSTDGTGKTTYTVSTSAEVFHYKGNKLTLAELPASGNTTGDVWSVGPADAEGSTLYAWDGDEWINIGGPNGVTDVDPRESHGVVLAKNADGTVKVNVTPGSVVSGNGSVVTGGDVYTAISTAEESCNTAAQGLINNLSGTATSNNGSYVNVTVTTSKGEVSKVTVDETKSLTDAIGKANSAMQSITILDHTISNGGSVTVEQAKKDLGLGGAAYQEISYFDKANTAQNLINALVGTATSKNGSYVNIKVDTKGGNVSYVAVTETDKLKKAVSYANSAVQTISGDSPYLSSTKSGTSVALNLDETEVFNYVANNIWETYSA